MSRTTRRHESRRKTAHRGPKNPKQEPHKIRKPIAQQRTNVRIQLRKEWI